MSDSTITRRELILRGGALGGMLAIPAGLRGAARASQTPTAPALATGLRHGPDIYESIGVRPLINARGTFTIISGSTMLPEVRAALDPAGPQHATPAPPTRT